MEEKKLLMDFDEKPKTGKWIVLSIQHVFAMFSATVLVPMLTGIPVSIALFSSGIGTLIYILLTKAKVPMYLGSSFVYIAYIQSILWITNEEGILIPNPDGGYGAMLAGIMTIGIVYVVVALIIKFVGVKWLNKLLPPIVVGPMIIVIGLSLASTAVSSAGLSGDIEIKTIIVALVTMGVTAVLSIRAKGFLKIIPFLIGIISGYVLALILSLLPGAKVVDLTALAEVAKTPSEWFKLPQFVLPGTVNKQVTESISIVKLNFSFALAAIPLAFATICEHIGDHQVLGQITGKNYAVDPGLHRTILGDGLATFAAGMIGSVPNTSYGENTAVVGMSKIGSVWVTGLAAIFAIFLSFCNVFTTLISTIPSCVMGGICLILYGFIASNGLKVLVENKVNVNSSRNIIIISVMLIIGLGGAAIYKFTGMALASIFGIILNLVLPKERQNTKS